MAKFEVVLEVDIEDKDSLDDMLFDHIPFMEDDYQSIIEIVEIIDIPKEESK